jgi:hypothetical protein
MATAPDTEWRSQFGIADQSPPVFFSRKEEIDAVGQTPPQAHLLRRAFDLLELNGILCSEHSPLAYFKQVELIDPPEIAQLHRRFWNHGGAPVLVLIAPDEVQIYSGLSRPAPAPHGTAKPPGFVDRLVRVAEKLRGCLLSLESGAFFHLHRKAFNPKHRVDRELLDNLQDTRKLLATANSGCLDPQVLDALLCRLVFTCYLFDREIIGPAYLEPLAIPDAAHLRDILDHQPKSEARDCLYRLFEKLGEDFNGDLFSDDLKAEAALVGDDHIEILRRFFSGTTQKTGQQSFWPYDFGVIPVETISAIYERFLKSAKPEQEDTEANDHDKKKRKEGAFYTPRFLAELVLDVALEGNESLIEKRYLDPACGSGIFLVGLFNRLADEWTRQNPTARNDRRSKELMALLRRSLFGVDKNRTACRIAAFSLYLAYLDQLLPRDIQELQKKGRALPRLIIDPELEQPGPDNADRIIWRGDFFAKGIGCPDKVDLVIGNPPWGSVVEEGSPAADWCEANGWIVPDRQIADVFVGKGPHHLSESGRVCFVLPHGTIFNRRRPALTFQRRWLSKYAVERVINLADYQHFLFEEAKHPAIVARYRKSPPANRQHSIHYWAPKTDWTVTQAEVITVQPEDRRTFSLRDVLEDLKGDDAPQIWKQRFWVTPRDSRLLDRLSLFPRLRDITGQAGRRGEKKWFIAEGFQPFGKNDPPESRKTLALPGKFFIPARSPVLALFLLEKECEELPFEAVEVRRLIKDTDIFRAPHVLVAKGFTSIAFADFDVSFRHAVRGIHGPTEDRNLLIFLAAYLRSSLARYFLFHTSSNWGVSRQEVHVEEMLRLPFQLPEQCPDPKRAAAIVAEVARIVTDASAKAGGDLANREDIVRNATAAVEPLIEEYFDLDPLEKMLIEDTVRVIIPSARPTRKRPSVPTILPATAKQREGYTDLLCETLNGWAKGGPFKVWGRAVASQKEGVGLVALEKTRRGEKQPTMDDATHDLLGTLEHLRSVIPNKYSVFDLVRGLKVFDRNRLYVLKPISQRFWIRTAALNDADEIAGTILMRSPREGA